MSLPADTHVHSEWSWDVGGPKSSAAGRMRLTCARAVAIGLPALIFTEHLDFDANWHTDIADLSAHQVLLRREDGTMALPVLDVDGYLDSVDRCRYEFPAVRILTGIEFGQPHLHQASARALADLSVFDRINGSLHTLPLGHERFEPNALFRRWPADTVMREYLAEIPRMVAEPGVFEVVTHIDYAIRAWPLESEGPFDPRQFEEEFRAAMRAIAGSSRALEMNTRRLWSWVPQWWKEEGGTAISFGSDSHVPETLAANFPEAVAMVEHFGFREGATAEAVWRR
jgi:histidinol-phosphatase (PHP family)